MNVSATIVDGPLPAAAAAPVYAEQETGAALTFEGIVRATEEGRSLVALDYEAYEGMAQRELGDLASEIAAKHGIVALHIWHSRGRVPVGQCSLRVLVCARHRKEAIGAVDEFIDRMKRDVPIWKHAVFATGGSP